VLSQSPLEGQGSNLQYAQCILFPGLSGIATAVGLFVPIWLVTFFSGAMSIIYGALFMILLV